MILPLILVAIAGLAHAAKDSFSHHYHSSLWRVLWIKRELKFFRDDSWKNKYIDDNPLKGRKKFLYGMANVPVALTDLFHAAQSVQLWSLLVAVVVYFPFHDLGHGYFYVEGGARLLSLILLRAMYGLTFWYGYNVAFVIKTLKK